MSPRSAGLRISNMSYWRVCVLALAALAGARPQHQRRTILGPPPALPLSKSGWRPVVGAGLPGYGAFGAAPLHAPYKIPIPVIDYSSSRPIVTRDASKFTSLAQSYRPTTIRTVQAAPNQPINSYMNPYAFPQAGVSHYKLVQNFPKENFIIRNPHGPFLRPYQKQRHKNVFDNILQQQQLPFDYKPHEMFAKPVGYARPTENKKPVTFKDPNAPEVFKPEVFELTDNTAAPQSVIQQVKTQQQQQHSVTKTPATPFQQYPITDDKFAPIPASLLGTFSSFGVQSMKNREPVFPTKTTYLPPAPTKQTIFNSFSFTPTFKSPINQFAVTTPKIQQTTNLFNTDLKAPTQVKQNFKTENHQHFFKASPQDPFHKSPQLQIGSVYASDLTNKLPQVPAYTSTLPTTAAFNSYFNDFSIGQLPSQLHSPLSPFSQQQNLGFEPKVPATQSVPVNNKVQQEYSTSPNKVQQEVTSNSVPFRATYEVTENYENGDIITHSSPNMWSASYQNGEAPQTQQESESSFYGKPTSTNHPEDLPEEYSIVTETNTGYENYNKNLESQNSPLLDNSEPFDKHKLEDYYYKISTPANNEDSEKRKESTTKTIDWDYSTHNTQNDNELNVEALPTLPPNKHFRRPSAHEPIDKDRMRKRTKNRRRRPQNGNSHRETEEPISKIEFSTEAPTTVNDDVYTARPRIRPLVSTQSKQTTPTITTDLSTSALPTTSSTNPTIIKKKIKINHRRPLTTPADRVETTTFSYKEVDESSIMKLVNRPQGIRATSTYDYKNETPDYSHKQDEKDTPTSDIAVSTSDNNQRNKHEQHKTFSFHKDLKPIEAVTEAFISNREYVTQKERNQKQTTENNYKSTEDTTEVTTFSPHRDNASQSHGKIQRPKLRNKYDGNRPRFSVKDYRNRLSSTTTTTTEKPSESQSYKLRFPQRRPFSNDNNENATESRKKFIPKDPRHRPSIEERVDQGEKEQSTRPPQRQRVTAPSTETTNETVTQKVSSRIRKRPKPTEEPAEINNPTPTHVRRVIRKKIKDSDIGESVNDITVTETTVSYSQGSSSERTRSESAIMKIAKDDKKHHFDQHFDNLFEHSKRVSDLTLAASKDYNTPGMFKTVSPTSRRIPNYFTIATDDPILPIEAFFPQLNQKKES